MPFLVYDMEEEIVTHRFQDVTDAMIVKEALNDVESVSRRLNPNTVRRIQNFKRYILVRDTEATAAPFQFIPTITLLAPGGAGAYANSANAPLPRS
jgi:hypothetical protein